MVPIRSFQSRVFLVLLLMGVLPTAIAVGVGALALGELGTTVGTLGPWDAVASSGQALANAAVEAAPGDTALARAAAEHREALSGSVRRSRLWALVADRSLTLLPFVALVVVLLLGGLALLSARWISSSLARPIEELVGWTERIARSEPLPTEAAERDTGIREFSSLRRSLRAMARELEEARAREVESTRLRAWTEMARRVAHELKNPLTPMRMAASTLARSQERSVQEPAEVLLEEIGRLDTMARTFSRFGRMPESPPSEVDLEELLDELARSYDTDRIPVRVSVAPDLPRIRAHYDLLTRALGNLVTNALEAMGAGEGTTAEDGPEAPDDAAVELRAEPDGEAAVRILVRDRGPGIPEELEERIWLPETTTKSHGTGLGLATVRQAADAHGGRAEARNHPEGGAVFQLRLPLSPTEGQPP